jgi:hypothetical protein
MYSLIDSSINLEANDCIVLFSKRHHALIGLEMYFDDKRSFYLMDFLPTTGIDLTSAEVRDSRVIDGKVRIRQFSVADLTKEQLFGQFHLSDGMIRNYRTASCTRDQSVTLLSLVKASQGHPPKFQINGNYAKGATTHNCITWAETHLKAAGIHVGANLLIQISDTTFVSSSDSFVAIPEYHTRDSSSCHIL